MNPAAATQRPPALQRPVLSAQGLSKSYGGVQALADVDLELRSGEVLALAGENGAGKSTLIGILGGARAADSGRVILDGEEVSFSRPADALAAGIGVVYQDPKLIPQLDVLANVFLCHERPRTLRWIPTAELRRRYEELSERSGLRLDPRAIVADLSAAEQQFVQILRVLAGGARVVILDEPTAAMSVVDRRRLFALMADLVGGPQPASIVLVSHFLEELEETCDRAVVLRNGRVIGAIDRRPVAASRVASMMAGDRLAAVIRNAAPPVPPGETVLAVRDLRVEEAPPLSLELRSGEVVGLAGLVGSGRTELLRAIATGARRRGGEVIAQGERLSGVRDAVRQGVVMLPEERRLALLADWPLWRNVTLPSLADSARAGFLDSGDERRRAGELLERMRVKAPSWDVPASALSGGNQQKVVFAKLLAAHCRVGLLDEPTHGIDIAAKAEVMQIIRELAAEGAAFLVAAAEFEDLLGICTRILTLHKGRLVGEHPVAGGAGPDLELLLLEATTGRAARPGADAVAPMESP